VAIETGQSSNGHGTGFSSDLDTLFLLGGVAMLIFGAGLVLSNPTVRRFLGQSGVGGLAESVFPDVERYLRLRSM
jgi:hypothetical protein